MRLNVGDRIYAISSYGSIIGVYVIERTTKTQAISGDVRFRQDDTNSIRPVGKDVWDNTHYQKETEELNQHLHLQNLRHKGKTLFNVNKLNAEQLEQIIAIITKND